MENFEYFSIKDVPILRHIKEQAKAARLADGADTEFTRYKRLVYYHLEVVIDGLLEIHEKEENDLGI